ncbi:MAG: hypothetical protein ACRD0C_20430 [Acidimicrobiia bacterium]
MAIPPPRPPGNATTLAETIDGALAGEWDESPPALAVLSWRGARDDDLELAVKRTAADPAGELRRLGPDPACLAVCLSRLEERTVRVTVAVDGCEDVTIVRHRHGRTERPEPTGGATAVLLREALGELRFST